MSDPVIETMMHEYDQLSAYLNANAIRALAIPPLVLSAIAGVLAYARQPGLVAGLAMSFVLFFLLVYLGFIHAVVNGIGIRLIVLENRINRYLRKCTSYPEDALTFYAGYIGQGREILPGFNHYVNLLYVPFILFLAYSVVLVWQGGTAKGLPVAARVGLVGLPVVLNGLTVIVLERASREVKRQVRKHQGGMGIEQNV